MTKCKLCQEEIKGMAICCSKGTICARCSEDIDLTKFQPLWSHTDSLWTLAETFFRRGKGEDISFEKVWRDNKVDYELITFDLLFQIKKRRKEIRGRKKKVEQEAKKK